MRVLTLGSDWTGFGCRMLSFRVDQAKILSQTAREIIQHLLCFPFWSTEASSESERTPGIPESRSPKSQPNMAESLIQKHDTEDPIKP